MRLVEGKATVESVDAFVQALADVGDAHGCAVQAFDAEYVAGREHLDAAVEHANRAFDRGENVARDRPVEILLYAAGRRQINRALTMGVGEGEQPVVVVVDSDEQNEQDESGAASAVANLLEPAETLGAGDEDTIQEFFEITDAERDAAAADLEALVCERVALLDVEK